MPLNESQQEVHDELVKNIIDHFVDPYKGNTYAVISAPAGTGKTYTANAVLDSIEAASEMSFIKIEVTGTTHKAAFELTKSTGRPTRTLASFLALRVHEYQGKSSLKEVPNKDPKEWEEVFVIIDEASGVDASYLHYIKKRCRNCFILFMGDPAQLPAVGSTEPIAFNSGFKTHILTMPMRQDPDSHLYKACEYQRHKALHNTVPFEFKICDGKEVVRYADRDEWKNKLLDVFCSEDFEESDCKSVVYSNAMVHSLNRLIAEKKHGTTLPVVDLTMVSVNPSVDVNDSTRVILNNRSTMEVAKVGDTSRLHDIDFIEVFNDHDDLFRVPLNAEALKTKLQSLAKQAKHPDSDVSWHDYYDCKNAFADLRHVYAGTAQTCQGGTYDEVFIDYGNLRQIRNPILFQRAWYVALSRAKYKVHLLT